MRNFFLLYMFAFFAYSFISASDSSEGDTQDLYEVYVLQMRWHTGLVFRTADVDPEIWPDIDKYQNSEFIDIGWGDEKFYQASGSPVLLAARAILWPTQSAMQLFPFSTPVASIYGQQARILKIPVSRNQLDELTRFVSESFVRDDKGNIQPSEVYGESDRFFLAHYKYSLFRTCNTWVAKAFRKSGFNVRSFCILNANQLFRQLDKIPGAAYI